MTARPATERVERRPSLPDAIDTFAADRLSPERVRSGLWLIALATLAGGLACWALGFGIVALWLFVASSVAVAWVLPMPYALVSPLFMSIFGWLVDMLPFLVLAGWTAVVLRFVAILFRQRRLPRGGKWMWLPTGLFLWSCLGIVAVVVSGSSEFAHFLLLLGMQFVMSGTLLLVVDQLRSLEEWTKLATGLLAFVVVLTAAVFSQWVGLPIESLQDTSVADRVEEAYGVNAFENNIGMIKWARAKQGGAGETRLALKRVAKSTPGLPAAEVFLPKFHVFDESVVARFEGSARPFEDKLNAIDIDLVYDNIGLAPANLVPRWRSFPRNALTYAGVCAALFPLALFLAWSQTGIRRIIGRLGMLACLAGAGFSLARGAWAAILIGIAYVLVDGLVVRRRKVQMVSAFVVAAVMFTGIFAALYRDDPLTARAGAESSVITRQELYEDTVSATTSSPVYLMIGYGTEQPRTESGNTRALGDYGKYVPRAGTHSTYLNYLFRAGIVGVVLIMAIYTIAALHGRAAAREWQGSARMFATLATAAVLVAAAHATILSLYVEPIYTLVISLVLGLGMVGAGRLSESIFPWRTRG